MSLKSCSRRSPRSTKRKPLWFELIQGCRNSRPPFQNHSPESGYWFLVTKGRHDSLPPSLHRPKLDNKALLSFSHTKSTLPTCKVLSFSFLSGSPCHLQATDTKKPPCDRNAAGLLCDYRGSSQAGVKTSCANALTLSVYHTIFQKKPQKSHTFKNAVNCG